MKTIDSKLARVVPPVLVIALLIAVWWLVVARSDSAIFPTPWQVVTGAWELVQDGTLAEYIGASLLRVGIGFSLAFLVAVPLGLWMGWVSAAFYTLNPLFQMLRPISPIAWIPVAILWFGVGNLSPIFLIFIASVFPMMVQTTVGVRTIDRRYLRAAVFMQDDITFACQLPQHFAHRRARDAIGSADFHLVEIGARLQFVGEDPAPQVIAAEGFLADWNGVHGSLPFLRSLEV